MIGTDYIGLAALVFSFSGPIAAIFAGVAAVRASQTHRAISNGGEILHDDEQPG